MSTAMSRAEGEFDQVRAEAVSNWMLLKQDTSKPLSVKATIRKIDSISKKSKDISFVLKQNRDSYVTSQKLAQGEAGRAG